MKGTIEIVGGDEATKSVTWRKEVAADLFGPWAVHGYVPPGGGYIRDRGHWVISHADAGMALAETARKADAVDLARRLRDAAFDPWPDPSAADTETWEKIRGEWVAERALVEEEAPPWFPRVRWCPTEDSPR